MIGSNFKAIAEKTRFHIFMLAGSLFFLLITISKSSVGSPEASVYWYASQLYWTFWMGLSFVISCIILSIVNQRKYLGFISVIMPVFYLYSLPNLLHEMVPVFDVYHVIPSVTSILETGSWNMASISFPSSHIYQAISIAVFDMDSMAYARIFPTILALTIVIFILAIARRFSNKWAPVAAFVFLSLNWYMEYHLARQPFGVMIWTAYWLALFLYIEKKDYRIGILVTVILLALVPAHPGMLIITSFNVFGLAVVTFLSFRSEEESDYLYPFVPILLIFGIGAALFYSLVPSINSYINSVYREFYQKLFESGTVNFSLGGPSSTSSQYGFVNKLRMGAGLLHSLLGFLGVITLYRKVSKRALFMGAWFFFTYIWLIYPLTQQGLYIERTFLAALIPASILSVSLFEYLSGKNYDLKRFAQVSAIVIIAAFFLLVPVTKNSIDSIETPSRPAYRAGRFAQENMEDRVYVTDTHRGMFKLLENRYHSEVSFRHRGKRPPDQPYGYPIPLTDNTYPSRMIFTDYFNNYLEIRYGNKTAVEDINRYEQRYETRGVKIYDSGGARVYISYQQ